MSDEDDDENRGVSCCVLKEASSMAKIRVDGNLIGIMELQRIMDEVRDMGPMDDDETRAHLIKRTKQCNYVPPKAEEAYADALLEEFRKTYGD
jgi:hypothetical protein